GIIDTRSAEVEKAVSEKFSIIRKFEENGWVCLVAML
ncbi:MAG: 50S ribosomal protein L11 methyltransferase, partial [Clostridia bacterium]|nr:50S ribosomal protein L11 methyltransferase [Clostridia bacterium]